MSNSSYNIWNQVFTGFNEVLNSYTVYLPLCGYKRRSSLWPCCIRTKNTDFQQEVLVSIRFLWRKTLSLELELSSIQQKHAGFGDTVQWERTKKKSLLPLKDKIFHTVENPRLLWISCYYGYSCFPSKLWHLWATRIFFLLTLSILPRLFGCRCQS